MRVLRNAVMMAMRSAAVVTQPPPQLVVDETFSMDVEVQLYTGLREDFTGFFTRFIVSLDPPQGAGVLAVGEVCID